MEKTLCDSDYQDNLLFIWLFRLKYEFSVYAVLGTKV